MRALVRAITVTTTIAALAVPIGATPAGAAPGGIAPAVASAVAAEPEDLLFFEAFPSTSTPRTLGFWAQPHMVVEDVTWDFGDDTDTGEFVWHTFPAGQAPVTVTMSARFPGDAETYTVSRVVNLAGQAPQLTVTPPPDGTRYRFGETIRASAAATDPGGGPVDLRWEIEYQQQCAGCPYYYDVARGADLAHVFPTVPALMPGGTYVGVYVRVTATGAAGITASSQFSVDPLRSTLDLSSYHDGGFRLNGSDLPEQQVHLQVGIPVTVEAAATALGGAAPFQRWSDGSTSRTRSFVMGESNVNLLSDYLTPIEARYNGDAGLRSLLGPETQAESPSGSGDFLRRWARYSNGKLFWSPATGTHEVHGAIANVGVIGWATTDELGTPDGIGRYNDFDSGWSVYWTAATGAHAVGGGIGAKWRQYGAYAGLGYPATPESIWMPEDVRYQHYSRGASIFWTAAGGAHEMHGGIKATWDQQGGYPRVGYPTTDELGTADGLGRFNHFSRGWSIYWTAATGAHEVHGGIRAHWQALGSERSYLGYPTSDELSVPGGARTNFQRGYILWNNATGRATDHRY